MSVFRPSGIKANIEEIQLERTDKGQFMLNMGLLTEAQKQAIEKRQLGEF